MGNVGPTPDGSIPPLFEERLRGVGAWLGVNGEAIYSSKPWRVQTENGTVPVWYTSKGSSVYAIFTKPPHVTLFFAAPIPTESTTVTLLGNQKPLQWASTGPSGGLLVLLP